MKRRGGHSRGRDHESIAKVGLVGQGESGVCLVKPVSAGNLGPGALSMGGHEKGSKGPAARAMDCQCSSSEEGLIFQRRTIWSQDAEHLVAPKSRWARPCLRSIVSDLRNNEETQLLASPPF